MDWLTALLFLLALGALAGFLWLHFGRSPGTPAGRCRGEPSAVIRARPL